MHPQQVSLSKGAKETDWRKKRKQAPSFISTSRGEGTPLQAVFCSRLIASQNFMCVLTVFHADCLVWESLEHPTSAEIT